MGRKEEKGSETGELNPRRINQLFFFGSLGGPWEYEGGKNGKKGGEGSTSRNITICGPVQVSESGA